MPEQVEEPGVQVHHQQDWWGMAYHPLLMGVQVVQCQFYVGFC